MARSNFTVGLHTVGSYKYMGYTDPVLMDAGEYCTESVQRSGGRYVPGVWNDPKPYYFNRVKMSMLNGIARGHTVGYPPGDFEASGYYDRNTWNALNDQLREDVSSHLVSMRDKAITKARLKMKDQQVNLGAALGEANTTARMVGDTALTIARSIRQLRRGNFYGAARDLGLNRRNLRTDSTNLHQRWLELQYGWKPLLSDVYGACDALAKRDKGHFRMTGISNQRAKANKQWFYGGLGTGYRCSVDYNAEYGVKCRIDALPENDLLIVLSQLGVTNPGTVAWELVPFSFVVDWFLPIGDFLNQLDALLGYSNITSSVSTFSKETFRGRGVTSVGPYGLTCDHNDSKFYCEVISLRREASVGSAPLPNLPRFKDPRSYVHLANGLSLLAQAFR